VDGRPDVLTFVSDPLTAPLKLSGRPDVNLYASTSGTDSDWVVKLIDVYPGTDSYDAAMGGYELRSRPTSSAGAIAPASNILQQYHRISHCSITSGCRW
jgi:predicted acyl esterase